MFDLSWSQCIAMSWYIHVLLCISIILSYENDTGALLIHRQQVHFSLLSILILFIHRWLTYTSTTTVNESRRVCGWLQSLVTRDRGPWFVPPHYYCCIVFLPYFHIDIMKFSHQFSTVPFTDSQSWRGRHCRTKKWFFDQQWTDERVLRSHILCALGCIVKHTVTMFRSVT